MIVMHMSEKEVKQAQCNELFTVTFCGGGFLWNLKYQMPVLFVEVQ
jgi:hypothetical protein